MIFLAIISTMAAAITAEILDVAIIGSGPGGLSCALALSKNKSPNNNNNHGGGRISIFERASSFRPIGAALGLNEMGYAALKSLGVADLVRSRAATPKWHVLQRPDGEVLFDEESMFAGTSFTWLGWYTLQTTLRESLLPEGRVDVNLQHSLVDFEEDEENGVVRLRFEVGEERVEKIVLARMLVGADGYHSVVRSRTVNDGPPLYTGTMTWRGVLDRKLFRDGNLGRPFLSEDEWGNVSIVGDVKNFWVMDCGNGQIAWTGTALQESKEKSQSALQAVLKAFENWPPIVQTLILATNADDIVESGVFDRDPVDSWGVSDGKFKRVTLLGDAAHAMRPSLGLGSTMAFQDALSLSEKMSKVVSLEDSNEVGTAIKKYEIERIGVTSPLQEKARVMGQQSHADDHADKMKEMLDASLARKRDNEL